MKLPDGFLLGAATAAHQVEGNNTNSDYWAQEHMKYSSFVEPSLDACDHYNRYEEDIKLMADAGLNAYRFSIEWARIEKEDGVFDEKEIEHYRKVLECCKENGIEPIVTMHHFTSPKWLISQGGWENEATVDKFARYCAYVIGKLGDLIRYVCTINEANMGIQIAAIVERYTKQALAAEGQVQVGLNLQNPMLEMMKKQAEESMKIFGVATPQVFVAPRTPQGDILVMKAHQAARKAIKEIDPEIKVGITLSLHDVQFVEGGQVKAGKEWEDEFLHYLPYIREDDFFGLQNYTRSVYGEDGIQNNPEGAELTQMDYEFYPQALENVIRKVHQELAIPLIITENGIATSDDSRRVEFIKQALNGVSNCLDDGIDIRGYCYWSLLDNFEWQKGYSMTFGLIAVDRNSQTRKPKESLYYLGSYGK